MTLKHTSLISLWPLVAFSPTRVAAQVFNGGSLAEGLGLASGIGGLAKGDIRSVVLHVLLFVLNFLALAAVVAIVVAGIYLIVGGGSDESKEKAKKIILYVIIGLLVILFARVIVGLMLSVSKLF